MGKLYISENMKNVKIIMATYLEGKDQVKLGVRFHSPQPKTKGEGKMGERRRYEGRFKAQVALEAIRNQQTISQIASQYGVHPGTVKLIMKNPVGTQ